jgi:DNA-binding NtrC family response regulator
MRLRTQVVGAREDTSSIATDNKSKPRACKHARILIVCDDENITKQLNTAFLDAGLVSESATSITAGCESAKSGRFQAVVTTPVVHDGSWTRLVDLASYYGLSYAVILVARSFDLNQWGEALRDGALEVLDAQYELPRAAETIKKALREARKKTSGHRPEAGGPPKQRPGDAYGASTVPS